ncbi:MAG: hypothetical protein QOH89_106, partial [Pseudonocardiales bacterium]|nr:hypothetical protein [Pseudonocardiales bacterium]
CNIFRYGQCNTQIHGVTAVVCRQVSCLPPWQLYPGKCGKSSATDNNTALHSAPCLTKANSFPALVTFPAGRHHITPGYSLTAGMRLVSADQHTQCTMQSDGNLVIRNQNGPVWSTRTARIAAGGRALLRSNGQLVVLDSRGVVRWSSHTTTAGSDISLWMRNNGQLAVFRGTTVIWHTNTHTP